jgi:hypothetical protein
LCEPRFRVLGACVNGRDLALVAEHFMMIMNMTEEDTGDGKNDF